VASLEGQIAELESNVNKLIGEAEEAAEEI